MGKKNELYLLLEVVSCECDTFLYVICGVALNPFLLSPCLFSQLQLDTLQDRHECLNDILLSWLMVGSRVHNGGLSAATLTFFGLSLCP